MNPSADSSWFWLLLGFLHFPWIYSKLVFIFLYLVCYVFFVANHRDISRVLSFSLLIVVNGGLPLVIMRFGGTVSSWRHASSRFSFRTFMVFPSKVSNYQFYVLGCSLNLVGGHKGSVVSWMEEQLLKYSSNSLVPEDISINYSHPSTTEFSLKVTLLLAS